MPNQNPAGANQPLNQHPIPLHQIYHVAADSKMVTGLTVASGDVQLVAPPPVGGVRFCPTEAFGLVRVDGSGTDSATLQLVYKDGGGREIVMDETTVTPGSLNELDVEVPYLLPSDEGIFIRVTDDSDGEVKAVAHWRDVRGVSRFDTVLSPSWQRIHDLAPNGNVRFTLTPSFEGEDPTAARILNYDDKSHTINLRLTDGSETINLGSEGPVSAGELASFDALFLPTPPGWYYEAQLEEAVGGGPAPRLLLPMGLTNQGPARQDQGGAY